MLGGAICFGHSELAEMLHPDDLEQIPYMKSSCALTIKRLTKTYKGISMQIKSSQPGR